MFCSHDNNSTPLTSVSVTVADIFLEMSYFATLGANALFTTLPLGANLYEMITNEELEDGEIDRFACRVFIPFQQFGDYETMILRIHELLCIDHCARRSPLPHVNRLSIVLDLYMMQRKEFDEILGFSSEFQNLRIPEFRRMVENCLPNALRMFACCFAHIQKLLSKLDIKQVP